VKQSLQGKIRLITTVRQMFWSFCLCKTDSVVLTVIDRVVCTQHRVTKNHKRLAKREGSKKKERKKEKKGKEKNDSQ
jgi:hypothetical protein